jgi:hypothetical protein
MKNIQQLSQDVAWEQPYPVRNQVGRYPVKDGSNLPNSVTEDIRGFDLLSRKYSDKQLRRIARLKMQKVKYEHSGENLKAFKRLTDSSGMNKKILIRRALAEEEGLF